MNYNNDILTLLPCCIHSPTDQRKSRLWTLLSLALFVLAHQLLVVRTTVSADSLISISNYCWILLLLLLIVAYYVRLRQRNKTGAAILAFYAIHRSLMESTKQQHGQYTFLCLQTFCVLWPLLVPPLLRRKKDNDCYQWKSWILFCIGPMQPIWVTTCLWSTNRRWIGGLGPLLLVGTALRQHVCDENILNVHTLDSISIQGPRNVCYYEHGEQSGHSEWLFFPYEDNSLAAGETIKAHTGLPIDQQKNDGDALDDFERKFAQNLVPASSVAIQENKTVMSHIQQQQQTRHHEIVLTIVPSFTMPTWNQSSEIASYHIKNAFEGYYPHNPRTFMLSRRKRLKRLNELWLIDPDVMFE